VERLSPEIDQLIPRDAKLETLASGYKWTEEPVWIETGSSRTPAASTFRTASPHHANMTEKTFCPRAGREASEKRKDGRIRAYTNR
jgi:hypothetical protein